MLNPSLTARRGVKSDVSQQTQAVSDTFVFIPITQQEAAKGRGAAKRIVRAHVTRIQHAKSSTLSRMQDLQSWTVKPYIHRGSSNGKRKPRSGASQSRQRTSSAVKDDQSDESSETSVVLMPRLPTGCPAEDPFWTFPVEYQPQLPPIFAHYIQNVAVENPDLDGPNEKGLVRRIWFPLAMTEAATMYAVLVMAASHYCVVNPSKAGQIDLLHLKARALSEINTALADPERATTDAIISAVMKIAAYESIFGDPDVFAAHMRGLQMMIKMRGGLSEVGGLLERMLVWIDVNASHLTGIPAAFGNDDFPTGVSFEAPDPHHFTGMS